MYLVPKKEVVILDSNIPDTDSNYPTYAVGVNYDVGVEVQYQDGIYRCLSHHTIELPTLNKTSLSWKYLKKANKWACFDEFNNTKTTHETEITYVVESRYVDYIGLINLRATKVKLELYKLTDDITTAEPLWQEEATTYKRTCYNYSEYITKDGTFTSTLLTNIFPFYGTKLKISITGTNVEVGNIIYGKKIDLGIVLAQSSLSLEVGNLIDIEIDTETGSITQVPFLPRKDLTIPVIIETKDYERVTNVLTSYLGTACLFVAVEEVKNQLPNVALYGFYKTLRVPIGQSNCEYELLIKGVL